MRIVELIYVGILIAVNIAAFLNAAHSAGEIKITLAIVLVNIFALLPIIMLHINIWI